MEIFKVLAVCLVTAFFAIILKGSRPEYALAVILAGGVAVTVYIFSALTSPINYIIEQLNDYGIKTEYFAVALKALGIGYVTGFIADACRDSGQASLATKAELAGKCAIFILSLPLVSGVLKTALGLLK